MKIEFPFCTHELEEAIKDKRVVKTWEDERNVYFMIKRKTKPIHKEQKPCLLHCKNWLQNTKQGNDLS